MRQVAKLFRALAEAETVHAHSHLRQLGLIKDTRENLKQALSGEVYEFQKMYPEMIATAKKENNKGAEITFTFANEVEKVHAALYQKALDELAKNAVVDYYVCQVCGYTVEAEPQEKCPVCGAARSSFKKID